MRMSQALFFYIDALDPNAIDEVPMPFLQNLVKSNGYRRVVLENVLGYSFAIQSSIFSGKYPDESNHWLPYYYSRTRVPLLFRLLHSMGRLSPMDRHPKLRYLLVNALRKFYMRNCVQANNIPLSVMDDFAFFPYYYPNELPSFNALKDLIQQRYNALLTYLGPPSLRGDRIYDTLSKRLCYPINNRLIIVYEDRLDAVAHKFGPTSVNYAMMAKHVDEKIREACLAAEEEYDDLILVFFSDHAQSDRIGTFDIISSLAEAGLEIGKDYVCFIDATIALFWPKGGIVQEKISSQLAQLSTGTVIDDSLRKSFHLCFENRKLYGEIIYVLEPGWTFFPNFFSPFEPMKGLHGYLPDRSVQKAFVMNDERLNYGCRHVRNLKDIILKCYELMRQSQ